MIYIIILLKYMKPTRILKIGCNSESEKHKNFFPGYVSIIPFEF